MAVRKLDGVERVEASYKEGRAELTYDRGNVTPEQIEDAIEKVGYQAELIETKEAAGT
jgi:copper chaperone CopZ